jgi:hypothetical protein
VGSIVETYHTARRANKAIVLCVQNKPSRTDVSIAKEFSGADHGFTAYRAEIASGKTARRTTTIKQIIMNKITKDQFVALLNDVGVTDAQKHKLHAFFETRHSEAHEAFLQWLDVPPDAIRAIRVHS